MLSHCQEPTLACCYLASLITSAVMGTVAIQIVSPSIQDMAKIDVDPNITVFSGLIIFLTVVLNGVLYYLQEGESPSVQALAVDHRNDVFPTCVCNNWPNRSHTLAFHIINWSLWAIWAAAQPENSSSYNFGESSDTGSCMQMYLQILHIIN